MARTKPKRFTVTLPCETYDRLKGLSGSQVPSLSMQYLVEYAINDLLDKAENPKLGLHLGEQSPKWRG